MLQPKDRVAEWIQEIDCRPRDIHRLKVRRFKRVSHVNGNKKIAKLVTLISDKTDFKIKTVTRDKEGPYIMIKGSIQEEDITIVNIYVLNTGAPQYIRQTLTVIRGEINKNTIIVGDFNTPVSSMDRSSKQNQ